MTIEQFGEALHRLPFCPFTIHMVDGRTTDVAHPDFVARSPNGRSVIVFRGDSEANSLLDMLLMSELEVHAGNGRPT
jgi:hypothetical protein